LCVPAEDTGEVVGLCPRGSTCREYRRCGLASAPEIKWSVPGEGACEDELEEVGLCTKGGLRVPREDVEKLGWPRYPRVC
jgi:hypothetical protein